MPGEGLSLGDDRDDVQGGRERQMDREIEVDEEIQWETVERGKHRETEGESLLLQTSEGKQDKKADKKAEPKKRNRDWNLLESGIEPISGAETTGAWMECSKRAKKEGSHWASSRVFFSDAR